MLRRNTKQKQLILSAVNNRNDHPTAEQIYNTVHDKDKSVSKGTVYRNLSILVEENQIQCLNLQNACRFDWVTDKHNHFVCSKCGKVYDIDIEYDNSLDNRNLQNGFYVSSHETYFRGLCPDCIKKEVKK